jgi:hypothetical protein
MRELVDFAKLLLALILVYVVGSVFGGSWDPLTWSVSIKMWVAVAGVVVWVMS